MKKLFILLFISITMTLLYSCSKKQENAVEPNYDVYNNMDSDNSDGSKEDQGETDSDEADSDKVDITESAEIIPTDVAYVDSETGVNPTGNPEITPIEAEKSKEWPYELDFKGVGTDLEALPSGNIDENIKPRLKDSCIMCPDKQNDCTYYINYGKDYFIYMLKDGVSTLLVDKKALYLQLWDNELYFIINDRITEDIINYGDIYCFNLATKELRLILKAYAFELYVNAEGIYYKNYSADRQTMEQKITASGYRLGFDSTTPEKVDYTFYYSFKDYEIYNKGADLIFNNKETQENIFLASLNDVQTIRILGKYFTFKKESCLYLLDLVTGEKKVYDLDDCSFFTEMTAYDYIMINNKIYITTNISNHIFFVDLTNGEITYQRTNIMYLPLKELFLADDTLFSVSDNFSFQRKIKLVELEFGGGIVTVKELKQ